jgi:hypothetical protein
MSASAYRSVIHFVLGLLDDELSVIPDVVGDLFDDLRDLSLFVQDQINPFKATANGSLIDFERVFKCVPKVGDSLSTRRGRVIAAIRATGDLNKQYFYRIAESLGYTIDSGVKYLSIIENYFQPFRAGYGRAGIDPVYSVSTGVSQYTVLVVGTGVADDADLQFRFSKQVLAGVELLYSNI